MQGTLRGKQPGQRRGGDDLIFDDDAACRAASWRARMRAAGFDDDDDEDLYAFVHAEAHELLAQHVDLVQVQGLAAFSLGLGLSILALLLRPHAGCIRASASTIAFTAPVLLLPPLRGLQHGACLNHCCRGVRWHWQT